MATSEGKIQTAICKELRKRGVFFFRVNNMPVYDPKLGGYRSQGEYALNGVPDIIAILPGGIFCGLEVKSKTGKPSADQVFFHKRCERLGARYHVVRSVEEAVAAVDNFQLTV